MEDIGIKTAWGTIEPFTNNSIPVCIRCGIRLTNENKSSWEDVIGNTNKTQGVCINCLTLEERNIDLNEEIKEK